MSYSAEPFYRFRLGASLIRRSCALSFSFLLLILPLAILAVVLFIVTSNAEPMSVVWGEFLQQVKEGSSFQSQLLLLLVMIVLGVIFLWVNSRAYIRLGLQGIEGYVPKWTGSGLTGVTTGHWQIRWGEIRAVSLVPSKCKGKLAQRISLYRLVIETDVGVIRLSPFFWVLCNGLDHRLTWRQALSSANGDAVDLIENSPLLSALRERGIKFLSESDSGAEQLLGAPLGFDLTKHRGMKAQLVIIAFVGLYILMDGLFLGNFKALEPLPVWPFLATALGSLSLVFMLTRGVPIAERAIVGLLTATLLTSAVYPGLLRVNAITAESQRIAYVAVGLGKFEAKKEGLPALDLSDIQIKEYWKQYPPGAEHSFLMQRGIAGFYQVNLNELYAESRDFYRNQ